MTDFVNRLYNDHAEILKRKEEKTKKAEEAWFKPEIGRSPLNARNIDNLPIHEHLTAVDKKSQEMKKAKLDSHAAKAKEDRVFKANPASQKLLQNMKRRSCEELFRVLLATVDFARSKAMSGVVNVNDSFAELVSNMQDEEEEEGAGEEGGGAWRVKLLDPTKCNPDLLDDNVAKIIKPLLARHQGSSLSLDFFLSLAVVELDRVGVEALDVVRTLRNRAREKKKLIAETKEGGGEMGPNFPPTKKLKGKAKFRAVSNIVRQFHPSINKNSAKLANRGNKKGRGELLFIALHSAQKVIDQKVENLRKQKMAEEAEECTFRPKLVAHTYKGAGNYPKG